MSPTACSRSLSSRRRCRRPSSGASPRVGEMRRSPPRSVARRLSSAAISSCSFSSRRCSVTSRWVAIHPPSAVGWLRTAMIRPTPKSDQHAYGRAAAQVGHELGEEVVDVALERAVCGTVLAGFRATCGRASRCRATDRTCRCSVGCGSEGALRRRTRTSPGACCRARWSDDASAGAGTPRRGRRPSRARRSRRSTASPASYRERRACRPRIRDDCAKMVGLACRQVKAHAGIKTYMPRWRAISAFTRVLARHRASTPLGRAMASGQRGDSIPPGTAKSSRWDSLSLVRTTV